MKGLVFVALVLVAAAALYLYSERTGREEDTVRRSPVPLLPETERADPRHPVAERAVDEADFDPDSGTGETVNRWASLPALRDSDEPIREALSELIGARGVEQWLVQGRIIERTVATVNSLDGAPIPLRFRPFRHVPGLPEVTEEGDRVALALENADRYAPQVELLGRADPEALVELYLSYYPLFQEAFEASGEPDVYFNDRLVEVIDHLLATPEITLPVELIRPEVFYEYADPGLEAWSFGRKILVRVGPENAAAIKDWLRRVRDGVATAGEASALPPDEES